jgi:hypothetical protein
MASLESLEICLLANSIDVWNVLLLSVLSVTSQLIEHLHLCQPPPQVRWVRVIFHRHICEPVLFKDTRNR